MNRRIGTITLADVVVGAYLTALLLNAFFVRKYPVTDMLLLTASTLFFVYYTVRLMNKKIRTAGLVVVVIAGLYEAVLILLQEYGWLESRHSLFTHTGSFFNPGLAGGFIACSLCVLIYFLTEMRKSSGRYCLLAASVLLTYALILTDSRAAWLAALAGVCCLFWQWETRCILRIKLLISKQPVLKISILALVLLLSLFGYFYKKSSADGRLFIWEVSLEMIQDKPLFGHGVAMFRSEYPHYQARFFEENPESDRAWVAGDAFAPFNEFLSILIEQGIGGFLLLSTALLLLFTFQKSDDKERKQKSFLLVWCVFACFSYPTGHLRTLVLLPFFMALLPSQRFVGIDKRMALALSFPILAGVILLFQQENATDDMRLIGEKALRQEVKKGRSGNDKDEGIH